MNTPYDLPDYHALIRGIRAIDRAGGDSALARLVTADFLQEHGEEERAEFVRVQMELSRLRDRRDSLGRRISHTNTGKIRPLHDREREILIGRAPSWWQGFPVITAQTPGGIERAGDGFVYEMGFVSDVRCPLAWWLTHGPDICRRHPVLEVVITGSWIHAVPATPWVPQRYVSQLSRIGTPEIISSVLSDIAYGRPRTTEDEVRGEVSAACLKWAEAEADTTPGG